MMVGVLGAGAMGSGIAQVAAMAAEEVIIFDPFDKARAVAEEKLCAICQRQVEKEKWSQQQCDDILSKISFTGTLENLSTCELIIEAVVENIEIKASLFKTLSDVVDPDCIIASNTSSLSIASLSKSIKHPERFIGLHFFNPAPLMGLVEIIPAITTQDSIVNTIKELMIKWGKNPAIAKDTPGFIVNRVARPFYGEALRIYDEGIADFATIDWATKQFGGFKMGPFQLMDFIGNDINYKVTCSVFEAFYYDPKYKPSLTQKNYSQAGLLGRKTGRGYYHYDENKNSTNPHTDEALGLKIKNRILVMLFNEAIDAVFWNIASKEDIDLAMTKGVNYPKGLLKWADEFGLAEILKQLTQLYNHYLEDRYRPSVLLKEMVKNNKNFYS